MRHRPFAPLMMFALLAACGGSQGPSAAAGETDASAVFAPVLASMNKTTQLQVRVPPRLPDMGQGVHGIHATVDRATADSYSIVLGTQADCTGGNYCRLGTIAAERVTGDTPALHDGTKVMLQGGIEGNYFSNACGATCPDNTIVWQQNSVRYTVGIKSGRQDRLVEMANAIIGSGR